MDLSIIIVNWNVRKLLCRCLDSIKENLHGINYEVIIIDNASTDDSVKVIREKYPWVRMVENKRNEGFAWANNQGFKMANGKYILMLNPDTLVIKKSIQTLMNVLDKNPRIGLVGPRIIDSRGLIDTAYKWYPPCLWGIFLERFRIRKIITLLVSLGGLCNTSYYKRWHRSRYVPFILGACMLFRKAELNRIGYLDERLPMFLDDIDLCHRFLKEGFNIYHCAEAEIVHLGGASLKKSEHRLLLGTMMLQGIDMFFAKYKSKTFIIIYHFILLISSLVLISFNLLMFPLLAISRRDISFIIKGHFRTLLYSISFKMNVPNENPSLI